MAGINGRGEAERAPPVEIVDRDGDGVPDADDRCPDQAGLPPDGCPPRDRDGDGILDAHDACPDEPGPADNRGCPDTDRDGDGVVDRRDRCPDVFGDPRFDGCVPPDRDGDGVPDPMDRCPDRAEVWNGVRDEDGCPDRGAAILTVEPGRVAVIPGPLFAGRGDRLSRRGRKAVSVAVTLLGVAGAQRVRVTHVPAPARAQRRAARAASARAAQPEDRARVFADALGAALPRLVITVEAPAAESADSARAGAAARERIEIAFE